METNADKIKLVKVEHSPHGTGSWGEDAEGCHWQTYNIDPFCRDCDCGGDECNPDDCPRFYDECENCGKRIYESGWMCMDGGDVVCHDCIDY